MTAKEKAKELVDNFYQLFPLEMDVTVTEGDLSWEYNDWQQSKKAALIAVDEMLYWTNEQDTLIWLNDFYSEVKQEITQL